jgi:hypothetical protein
MKRYPLLVTVALPCLMVGGAATAAFFDGNKLFQECQGGDDPRQSEQGDPGKSTEWGECLGYILGVEDALDGTAFCLPDGVRSRQVRDIVTLWLQGHPETRHYEAQSLVITALKEKFPCH